MNFCNWLSLNEGFTIDTSAIAHDELQSTLSAYLRSTDMKERSNLKNQLVGMFYNQGRFRYSAKDGPEDLLRITPVSTAREISYVDDLKHPLRTFKAKIYYGFEFPTIYSFGDTHASMPIHIPMRPPKIGQQADWRGNRWAGALGADIKPDQKFVQDARVVNAPSYRAAQEIKMQIAALERGEIEPFMIRKANNEATINELDAMHGNIYPGMSPEEMNKVKLQSPTGYTTPKSAVMPQQPPRPGYQHSLYVNPMTFKPYNLSPDENVARRQADRLLVQLKERLAAAEKEQQGVDDKFDTKSHFHNQEETEAYYQVMKLALTKMFKEPPPGQDSVVSQFADIAIQNFVRLMDKKYDYVLYPESSKPFNKKFAAKMAKAVGAQALEAFHKLPGTETTLNRRELRARYKDKPESYEKKQGYLQSFVDRANKSEKPMKISSVTDKSHRKYFNIFSMDEGEYAGKNILIVDDNVDAGGTFEILYSMVIKKKPASLDVYSPLRMSDHHH